MLFKFCCRCYRNNSPTIAKINCKTNIRIVIQSGYFWWIIKSIQGCFKRKWPRWRIKLYWTNNQKKTRKWKIIWFNPLFSRSVKSNIGRIFLRLLSKLFPRNHTMHKIFNWNTVKISYSCLRNISSIISSLSRNILSPTQQSFGSNCWVKSEWPLNGECQTLSVIFRADVVSDSNDKEKFYFGLADTAFKESHRNHIGYLKH